MRKKYGTFGWGKVSNNCPNNDNYFFYDEQNNCLRCTVHTDVKRRMDDYHKYTEIYRLWD